MNEEEEKLYNEILSNPGDYKNQYNEDDYGKYLIPCFAEILVPLKHCVGRVVQVREGFLGKHSPLVFVRCGDGTLIPWANQSFFEVKEEYIERLDKIFYEINRQEDLPEERAYGYNYPGNKEFIAGFIIPCPEEKI